MDPKRRNIFFILYTFVHAGLSLILSWTTFNNVMDKFDTGETFTFGERLLHSINLLLLQLLISLIRLSPILGDPLNGLLGYIIYLINGFLWALFIWFIIEKIQEKNRRPEIHESS